MFVCMRQSKKFCFTCLLKKKKKAGKNKKLKTQAGCFFYRYIY